MNYRAIFLPEQTFDPLDHRMKIMIQADNEQQARKKAKQYAHDMATKCGGFWILDEIHSLSEAYDEQE